MQELLRALAAATVVSLAVDVTPEIPLGKGHPSPLVTPLLRHGDGLEQFWPTTVANEITIHTQHTGTHIDALSHIGFKNGDAIYVHGGKRSTDIESHRGFKVLDAAHLTPFVGRAVVLDVATALGCDVLPDSYAITVADLERTIDHHGLTVAPGDAALVRTGFMKYWESDPERFSVRAAGLSLEAARYLVDGRAVGLIGSDTQSVEVIPTRSLEVHRYCIYECGLPLMENLNLEKLRDHPTHVVGLVVAPLRLVGATASMVNPLAIV